MCSLYDISLQYQVENKVGAGILPSTFFVSTYFKHCLLIPGQISHQTATCISLHSLRTGLGLRTGPIFARAGPRVAVSCVG
jgi:hypothetical protein